MEYRQALPVGSQLASDYRITGVLGQGGFGLTYKADELRLHHLVAIKEYFPGDLALRERGTTVVARSERDEDVFEWGRTKFLDEARTLARFRHPNIVRVARLFEANNTAYMVLDFEMGPNLGQWREALARAPTQDEIDAIAGKLLDAVGTVHSAGLLHRDIKPANVIMRDGTEPVLIDFGAARQALSAQSKTVHAIVTPGYSPKEQYAVDLDRQGAWSDIYALGATLFFLVTGKAPPDALSRDLGDTMSMDGQATARYRTAFLAAIEQAMRVRAEDRPQSVAELKTLLGGPTTAVPSAASLQSARATVGATMPPPSLTAGGAQARDAGQSKPVTFDDLVPSPASSAEQERRPVGFVAAAVIAGVLALGGLWYWVGVAAPARDEAAWVQAMTADTVDDYDKYVREQPSGRHLDEARTRRRALTEKIASAKPPARPEPASADGRQKASGGTIAPALPTPVEPQQQPTPKPPQGQAQLPTLASVPVRATLPAAISDAELATLARAVPSTRWRLAVLVYSGETVAGFSQQQADFAAALAQVSGNRLSATALTGTANVSRNEIFERLRSEKDLIAWHAPNLESARHGEYVIFSGAVPFGLPPSDHVRWMREDGARLLEQSYALYGTPVRAIPCGIAGGSGAWFRKEIRAPADFRGVKIMAGRILGTAVRSLGAELVNFRTVRDVVAAYKANRLDAFAGVSSLPAAFAGSTQLAPVYHYPGVHNPSYLFDLLIGAETWASLGLPQRRLIDEACRRNIERWTTVFPSSQNDQLNHIRSLRVTVRPFTAPVREALQKATNEALAVEAAKSPTFKAVLDSYNRFRR